MKKTMLAAATVLALCGCSGSRDDVAVNEATSPYKKGAATADAEARREAAQANAAAALSINYNGGPIMPGTPNVYFIWYGNWTGHAAQSILPDLVTNISGSPYLAINTTYSDSQGRAVTGNVHYAGSTSDNYSRGSSITEGDVFTIVQAVLAKGTFPLDENAVYFVLTSADVRSGNFCSGYCGWHENGTMFGKDIKYSFVGNAETQCPASCAPYAPYPNGSTGADGMASVLAHELEESLTDPDINAWVDSATLQENADKCAWKFGTTYATANGGSANMKLGNRDFLIQQNLDRRTLKCETVMPATQPPPAIKLLSPTAGATLKAGGPLDVVATITGSAGISTANFFWGAAGTSTKFAMAKNAAGNWELATTMSTTAVAGARSLYVVATDANGLTTTSPTITLQVTR